MSEYEKFSDRAVKEQLVAERAVKAPNLLCFIEQFPLAMVAVAGCHDYERGPLVKGDYRPSLLRHLFKIGEHPDHDAAVAWNAVAQLEIKLRQAQSATPTTFGPAEIYAASAPRVWPVHTTTAPRE